MIKETVLATIEKHGLIEKHQHIVIGLSGGPDSVCLFHILREIAGAWDLTLYPVHVNHGLRPGDADSDQAFVESLCRETGLSCDVVTVDCAKMAQAEGLTGEEAGRKARYTAFAEVARRLADGGVDRKNIRIAVAHNADDQAETILFRILRGTGTDGLSGIRYKRYDEEGMLIIRPLLDVYKADILAYCADHGLKPCIDKTNEEPLYTRNKIRLSLIPMLEAEYNERIKETIIRMGENAAADSDYLRRCAEEAFTTAVKSERATEILFDGAQLCAMDKALLQRVLARAFCALGLTADLSYVNYKDCFALIENPKPSARLSLPKGYFLTKVYADVKVFKAAEKRRAEISVRLLSRQEYEELHLTKNAHAVFDQEAFAEAHGENAMEEIQVDGRKAGDYFFIRSGKETGAGGAEFRRKKLQDFLVDGKVPKDERDDVDLVKVGNEVLWILPGKAPLSRGRYTEKYALRPSTNRVICIEIIC